jgi:hypothetical protein
MIKTTNINHESTKGPKHEKKRKGKFRAFKISCFRDENKFGLSVAI